MASKDLRLRISLWLLILGMVASVPGMAGSAVIGSVAGSTNATLGGQAVLPNTTVFSGDSLQVKDGVAVVAIGGSSRMVFGRETVASFLRDAKEITVLLSQGNVSLYHPNDGAGLRVKAGEISITPATGFKTLGDIAMVNGAVVVTSKEGLLRVEGNGPAVEVAKGKTITVLPKAARAPATGAGAGIGAKLGSSTTLAVASLAAGVVGAIEAGVAISRANDARDAATDAGNKASSATTAANAATSAGLLAQSTALNAGCGLNTLATKLANANVIVLPASPFTPPTGGGKCP